MRRSSAVKGVYGLTLTFVLGRTSDFISCLGRRVCNEAGSDGVIVATGALALTAGFAVAFGAGFRTIRFTTAFEAGFRTIRFRTAFDAVFLFLITGLTILFCFTLFGFLFPFFLPRFAFDLLIAIC